MSEGKKNTVMFTQEVQRDAAKDFRVAVTEKYGKTHGHMIFETSLALKERAEKIKEGK